MAFHRTHMASPPEEVLALLRERNRVNAAACKMARMQESMISDCQALDQIRLACERLEQESETAKGAEAQAIEATRAMSDKLQEALAKAADLEDRLKHAEKREDKLKDENEKLFTKLTELLHMRASAMDSEREEHEQRLASQPAEEPEQRAGWLPAPNARDEVPLD